MNYEIVPGSIRHVRPLSRTMRSAGAMAVENFGFNPREGLRRTFVESHSCETALVDGRPIAMWGLVGSLLGETVYAWLVLSDEAGDMPLAVVKEARKALSRAAGGYRYILATMLPEDEKSVRFARFIGFTADEERIPVGDSFVLKLRYQPDRMN